MTPQTKRLGAAQLIDFTRTDGRIVKRWMRPVLRPDGGWSSWVPARIDKEQVVSS